MDTSGLFFFFLVQFISGVPSGILMCEIFCRRMKGCKYYELDVVNLLCHIREKDSEENRNKATFKSGLWKLNKMCLCSPKGCHTGERCFRNRAIHDICTQHTAGDKSETATKKTNVPALFFIPFDSSKECRFQQVYLQTKQKREYRYLAVSKVRSLSYMPLSRKLLISTETPPSVLSHQLKTKKTVTLGKGKCYKSMVVDENRKILFSLVRIDSYKIYKLSLSHQFHSSFHINLLKFGPKELAIDCNANVLYISGASSLASVDYRGRGKKYIVKGRFLLHLDFDPVYQTLYYSSRDIIMKMNLYDKTSVRVFRSRMPRSIQYYDGNIYVMPLYIKADHKLFIINVCNETVALSTIGVPGQWKYQLFVIAPW